MPTGNAVWVELVNDTRSMLVTSTDWMRIRVNHRQISIGERSFLEGGRYVFFWAAQDARALSDMLESEDRRACEGSLMVDLDFGNGIRGTGGGSAKDGLTPEERTGDLIRFLREGSFRWTLVLRPYSDEPA